MKKVIKLLAIVIASFAVGILLIKVYEDKFVEKPQLELLEKPYFQLTASGMNDYLSENHNFFLLIIKNDIREYEESIIDTINEHNLATNFIVLDARNVSDKETKIIKEFVNEDKLNDNFLVEFSEKEVANKLKINSATTNSLIRAFLVKGIIEND